MAFYRKLTEGWKLTDGILPEMEMDRPVGVYEALRENGIVRDANIGMNAMACEWISARRWVYSLTLEAPDEGDDRTYIELPKVIGRGEAAVNGETVAAFESGAARIDLTGKLTEGENKLEISFEPELYLRPQNALPVAQTGLRCAPVLRTANYVTVETVSLTSRTDGEDGVIRAEFNLNVHSEGKYTFRYSLMGGDEPAGQHEMHETLTEGSHTVCHELKVEKPVRLDVNRMEDTVYGVRFSLEKGGVGCDVRHMETAFRKNMRPRRCFAAGRYPMDEETAKRLLEMGADGIVLTGMPKNAFEKNDFLWGLTAAEDGARADGTGMISPEKLKEYAQDLPCWPLDTAVWKLRGGQIGPETRDVGAEKYAAAMRLHQAQHVLDEAGRALREGRPVIAQLDEEFGYFASPALIEKDGSERPALSLLKEKWRSAYACCELPEGGRAKPDTLLHLNVWAMAETLPGEVLSASVHVANIEGEEIASTTFPVMGGDMRMAGVMNLRTPKEEALLIVRTELLDAGKNVISRTDSVLAATKETAAGLIAAAPRTRLSSEDGKVRNEGGAAALSAGLCLMPGEETDRRGLEWLNAGLPAES
ncbi:MAG: hypothetical protein IJE08_00885 [Clostridia bacterium]|nr:hypothetical protein [Clostridia bacterium]